MKSILGSRFHRAEVHRGPGLLFCLARQLDILHLTPKRRSLRRQESHFPLRGVCTSQYRHSFHVWTNNFWWARVTCDQRGQKNYRGSTLVIHEKPSNISRSVPTFWRAIRRVFNSHLKSVQGWICHMINGESKHLKRFQQTRWKPASARRMGVISR